MLGRKKGDKANEISRDGRATNKTRKEQTDNKKEFENKQSNKKKEE